MMRFSLRQKLLLGAVHGAQRTQEGAQVVEQTREAFLQLGPPPRT